MNAVYALREKKVIEHDIRRLTGPNVIWDRAGAVNDVYCSSQQADELLPIWQTQVEALLQAVGWSDEAQAHWRCAAGISLAFSAPIDALYAATSLAEVAWQLTLAELGQGPSPELDVAIKNLRSEITAGSNAQVRQLHAQAQQRQLSCLSDDEELSLGLGHGSRRYPIDALPDPHTVPWSDLHNVPVALVTGTNGKTTTVRLAGRIMRAAGLHVGMSSTDWIAVDDRILDTGDYSGPGGARAVLRETDVDAAILEAARGGLLRRGLGVNHADVALITNIAEDHLGDFGSQNLQELLSVKWVISQALDGQRPLLLNADDPLLLAKSSEASCPVAWFGLNPGNPKIQDSGIASVIDDQLCLRVNGAWRKLCPLNSLPITLGGAARHNVANAVAAAALCHQLGAPDSAIIQGLQTFSAEDNPGRCNLYEHDGIKVLVDFAHNAHGVAAILELAQALPAQRRALCLALPGDRTDAQVRDMAHTAWAAGLDRVIVAELAEHHRGRTHGEIYGIMRQCFLADGAREEQIGHHEHEPECLHDALNWAQAGDLIVMLALSNREEISRVLQQWAT